MEGKIEANKVKVFSYEQIAAAWHSLSIRLETCQEREEIKHFIRSTVTRIEKQKDGWKVFFLLPSSEMSNVKLVNKGSTTDPNWHPVGVLIELFYVA